MVLGSGLSLANFQVFYRNCSPVHTYLNRDCERKKVRLGSITKRSPRSANSPYHIYTGKIKGQLNDRTSAMHINIMNIKYVERLD